MVNPRLPLAGWQTVIGIETHVKLATKRKLFSNALTALSFNRSNTFVDLHDSAFPGTLPKLNYEAVDFAIRTALALGCRVATDSTFDRKHYFYHDLPSGYQITQHYAPIARNGTLFLNSRCEPVRIKQIQLEQDTAKTTTLGGVTQVDLNRAGQALLEIVTEPDMNTAEEASSYIKLLQSVLRAIGVSDGNMELGSLRVDVNVSINPRSARRGSGTRCEIKNLNSVKSVASAIEYEISRQHQLLTSTPARRVEQLTLTFDASTGETVPLRSKEDAPDYRYMPDPNLGTLRISHDRMREVTESLPPLPWEKRQRLRETYGLRERDIGVLMDLELETPITTKGIRPIEFFERVCRGESLHGSPGRKRDPIAVANWMLNTLLSHLTCRNMHNPLSPGQVGVIVDMVQEQQLTGTSAKFLVRTLFQQENPSALDPHELAKKLELVRTQQTSSVSDLEGLCLEVMETMPSETAALVSGTHPNVLNKIVGGVMKKTKGKADAKGVADLVQKLAKEWKS